MQCNINPSTLVGKIYVKHLDYDEETILNLPLVKNLIEMDVEFIHLNSKTSDHQRSTQP